MGFHRTKTKEKGELINSYQIRIVRFGLSFCCFSYVIIALIEFQTLLIIIMKDISNLNREGKYNWRESLIVRKRQLQFTNRALSIAAEINEVRLSRLLTGRESPRRKDTIVTTLLRICSILGFSAKETYTILLDASKGVIHSSELPTCEELGIKMGGYQAQRLIELLQEGELSIVETLLKNYNFSSLVGEPFRIYLSDNFSLNAGVQKDQILEQLFYIAERSISKVINEKDFNQQIASLLQFCFHYTVSHGGNYWKLNVKRLLNKLSKNVFGHLPMEKITNRDFHFILRGEKLAEELIKSGDPDFLPYLIGSNRNFLESNIFFQQKYLYTEANAIRELITEIAGVSFAQVAPYALSTLHARFLLNSTLTTKYIIDHFRKQNKDEYFTTARFEEFKRHLGQNLSTNSALSNQWKFLLPNLKDVLQNGLGIL